MPTKFGHWLQYLLIYRAERHTDRRHIRLYPLCTECWAWLRCTEAPADGGPQQSCDAQQVTTSSTQAYTLTASGQFGDHVMLTTSRSVVVIDDRQLTAQCDWNNVTDAGATVWIEPLRL